MKKQQPTEYDSQTKSECYLETQQKQVRSKSYLFQQPQYKISKKNYEMIENIIKTMEQNQCVDQDNMYCIYKEDYDIQYILNNNGIKVVVRRYDKWQGAKLLNYKPTTPQQTGFSIVSFNTNNFPNATKQWSVILSDFNLQILKGVPYKQFFAAMKKKQYFQPRITKDQVSFVLKYDVVINYNKYKIQKQFNFSKDELSNVQIQKLYYMHYNMLKLRSQTKSQVNLLKNYLEKTNKLQDSY